MNRSFRYGTLFVAAGTLLVTLSAQSAEVYKWVDADGVTHYSESAPQDSTPVETLTLESTDSGDITDNDDFYSVLNQVRRLEEARRADEALRIQRRAVSKAAEIEALQAELDAAREAARIEAEANRNTIRYFPIYTPRPRFGFPHDHHRNDDRRPQVIDKSADDPASVPDPSSNSSRPREGRKKGWTTL